MVGLNLTAPRFPCPCLLALFRAPRPAAFQVTTGGKSWFIKAQEEDPDDLLTNWVSAIRGAIAR